MLTPESLQSRLSSWSARFRTSIDPIALNKNPSPILLYQFFFGLMHDLKSSIHLSSDASVRALAETVMASDTHLYRLAYDEFELARPANSALFELGKELSELNDLQVLLDAAMGSARSTTEEELELFKLDFPWEGLARARATSCARHSYRFYTWQDQVSLSELPNHDDRFSTEVRNCHGIVVVRKLEAAPVNLATKASEDNLELSALTLAAFAPSAKAPPMPWHPLEAFRQSN